MTVPTFIGAVALFLLVLVGVLSFERTKPVREGLSGLGGLLTLAAALLGVYWYLEQRPDAARIAFGIEASVLPAGPDKALVVTEVQIENKGSSVITFRPGDTLKLFLQRVTPLDPGIADGLAARDADGNPVTEPGEIWVRSSAAEASLEGVVIEAQESEHFYFRTLLDCAPDLTFYVMAKMNAKYYGRRAFGLLGGDDKAGKVWVRQRFVDARGVCGKESAK